MAAIATMPVVMLERSTDTDGLEKRTMTTDSSTETAPFTVETRAGPDGAANPEVVGPDR